MKNKKAPILICAAVIFAAAAAAVFALPEKKNLDFFAMDTLVNFNITARGADIITEEAKNRVNALDTEVLSRQSASSEIYSLNKNHGGKMSEQVGEYISVLLDVFKKSGGAFDFTLGALSDLWGFGGEPSVPPEDKIGEILALTGADKITINGGNIEFPQGAVLDFGAAGKGIALDEIKEILDKYKAKEAVISVGGSILVYGGRDFKVGIRDPRSQSGYAAVLTLGQACVSTSGSYERFFESGGRRYHHILDPKTGHPAENGLVSATVISDSGILSDALSTACFVSGLEEGMALARSFGCEAVFIDENDKIYTTPGIADSTEITGGGFTKAVMPGAREAE